ncbi:hypothetical protein V4F39_06735 [Aquincola sp. MAHUQ-54]|uniref:Uncharacterized protein n=1 Tax=Aquincola agrisoli TaxID=3119538 RepID=A0AAW9Q8M8_9BURK
MNSILPSAAITTVRPTPSPARAEPEPVAAVTPAAAVARRRPEGAPAVPPPGSSGDEAGPAASRTSATPAGPAQPPLQDLELPFSIGFGAGSTHGGGCGCAVCQSWGPLLPAMLKAAGMTQGTGIPAAGPTSSPQRDGVRTAGYGAAVAPAAGSRLDTSA